MYQVIWDSETGGILLSDSANEAVGSEIRPVFHEELDLLSFNQKWSYPRCRDPLLWATAGRRYFYRGTLVAEAKGGGFFEKPRIEFFEEKLDLRPVDVPGMLVKNARIMDGLVQEAIVFIQNTHERYHKRVDTTAVAFSGGKDSLVLLDLVQRALSPCDFVIVFSDTTMEISATLESIERAKSKWSHLTFYTARAVKDAQTTWRELGPPSRIHRWCCTVHKSAPTLLFLRKLVGKPAARALILDGVRWDESQARSGYKLITEGGKHNAQTNVSPILKWNAGEVFLYLLERKILLNDAYRYGFVRVGCAVCPMASKWWDSLVWMVYRDDTRPLINILQDYARAKTIEEKEVKKFITEGGWKGRAGGRNMDAGGNRVLEDQQDNVWKIIIRHPSEEWLEWAKALGTIVREGIDHGQIDNGSSRHRFHLTRHEHALEINIEGISTSDRFFVSYLRAVNYKVAYCVHCKGCEVECPTGALKIDERVCVDEQRCTHCKKCLTFTEKGCLAARSLAVSKEGSCMKGLNRYQHFGMRKKWLEDYFRDPESWWHGNDLGNRQFDAMKVWLREAEIISQNKITLLGSKLREWGADSFLCWAVVWANLVRNSALVNWYVTQVPWKSAYNKNELIDMIDKSLSQSSRQNSVTSLVGLLRDTPLGNDLGFGEVQPAEKRTVGIYKRGWDSAHPLAVLYSLYRYAERMERHHLSLGELFEEAHEGPYTVFGIPKEELEGILRGLSSRHGSWLSIELVRDLDNIYLDPGRKSEEVLGIE